MANQTEISSLTGLLGVKFIDSMREAEEVARAFMKCGRNRNILQHRELTVRYVAAAVYSLAHHLPMRVRTGNGKRKHTEHIRFRSKVGDLAHLAVLLSLHPKQVFSFIFRYQEVQQYIPDVFQAYSQDNVSRYEEELAQIGVNMSHIIGDAKFVHYTAYNGSLWVSAACNIFSSEHVTPDVFDVSNMDLEEVVKRTRYNVSLVVSRPHMNENANMQELGERFRILRGLMGYTQKQLAEQLGITAVACNRMESGGPVSAGILLNFLCFYASYFNIDILFDKRMWELAQFKHEVMYKKVHITSVVNRKLKLMKQVINESLSSLQQQVNKDLGSIYRQVQDGMDSAISLTDDD